MLDFEVAIEHVRSNPVGVIGISRVLELAFLAAICALFIHQPCNAFATDATTLDDQCFANPGTTVGLSALLVKLAYFSADLLVLNFTRAHRSMLPCVIAASRDFENSAKNSNWEVGLLHKDELES